MGLTVALVLAEILNVVQVFTPAHMLLLFVTVVTVVQRSASRKCQTPRVIPENTWEFPGIFGYYPALVWTVLLLFLDVSLHI